MSTDQTDYRCSAASVLRDESLTATASTVRAFLLVEHTGAWGVDALRDARLPDGLGRAVAGAAADAGVRPLLVRRPDRRAHQDGLRVFAVHAHPVRPWVESTVLADPHDLLGLDLAALGAGRSPGLTPYLGSLFCVCTHGRHDACCAERGRPVAAALEQAYPEETWEVSHIGGDRFAGNLLVLPDGLYYGRLDRASAIAVAGAHLSGELDLDHLRGRSGFALPVQAAEAALRRTLAVTRNDAVRLVGRSRARDVTEAVFDVAGARYAVRVRSAAGPVHEQLTCKARRRNPVPDHTVVSLRRLP